MAKERQRLRARHGFAVPRKGTTRLVVVKGGQEVWSDDPIVKGRTSLFDPIDERPVEQATAGPGELRAATPKAARKAKEAKAKESNEGPTKGLTLKDLKGEK